MNSIFLSHSTSDKAVAREIARCLESAGISVWLDEAELKVGDSLIEKISAAIQQTDYVAAVISTRSVESNWVKKELSLAMTKEIAGKRVVVLPIKVDGCQVPFLIADKLYADISTPELFKEGILKIVDAVTTPGLVAGTGVVPPWQVSTSAPTTPVGERVVGAMRPPQAYRALRATGNMRTISIFYAILSVLVILVGMAFGLMKIIPLTAFLSLEIGGLFAILAIGLYFYAAAAFDDAFYSDPNVLLAVEEIGLWTLVFGKVWRAQYRLTSGRRRYRTAFWANTAGHLCGYAALVSVVVALFLFFHKVGWV
jgi:hypothetical protein